MTRAHNQKAAGARDCQAERAAEASREGSSIRAVRRTRGAAVHRCSGTRPRPRQVLVKTPAAVGVCKADWRVRPAGSNGSPVRSSGPIGYEMAGTIAGLGPGVSGFELGQPVHVGHMAGTSGTYAEYMAVTADDVAPMPSHSFRRGSGRLQKVGRVGSAQPDCPRGTGTGLVHRGAAGGVRAALIPAGSAQRHAVIASAGRPMRLPAQPGCG